MALAGCAPPPTDEAGMVAAPIANGALDDGDPAAVALMIGESMICTGTLVRPSVVLTAAHCVPPNIAEYATSYQELAIHIGHDVGQPGVRRAVVDGWTHPGFGSTFANDIALLRLEAPAPVVPVAFAQHPMGDADIGSPLRIIGFGIYDNDTGAHGVKHHGIVALEGVYPDFFHTTPNPGSTCPGDSGGPTLRDHDGQTRVVGVHSGGDCDVVGIETRVELHLDALHGFIGESPVGPGCGADGQCATSCGFADVDCPCAADGLCSESCGDPASDPECNPGCGSDGACQIDGCLLPDPDCAADVDEADDHDEADEPADATGCALGAGPSQGQPLLFVLAALTWRRRRQASSSPMGWVVSKTRIPASSAASASGSSISSVDS
jgi:hypothetical protein